MPLRDHIEHEIRERGPMPFSRYMELCLYHPTEGYYSRSAEQFGKAGDFYTSSDVHAVFGRLLSRQFEEMWRALDCPARIEILELGPGRGLFARDVLDWSQKKFSDFFTALTYTLQETSPALRAKLEENLSRHISSGKAALSALQGGAGETRPGGSSGDEDQRWKIHRSVALETPVIIFANEFFDALPVEILSAHGKLHLGFEDGCLTEIWLPPAAEELEFLDRHSVHPGASERIEVSLVAQRWAREIAAAIGRGFLVVIDYGYTRSEQLAGRHRGTLMAYRQHSASANPYQAPGEQDLTAHVNFTALIAVLEQAGMHAQKLVTQSQFLMGVGERNQFADAFEECRLPQERGPQQARCWPAGVEERAKVALQLKHLVSPVGMGETFQVLIASGGMEAAKVEELSGLRFGR